MLFRSLAVGCLVSMALLGCGEEERRNSHGDGGGGDGGGGGSGGAGPACGNGVAEEGEECDDGGPSATCTATCTTSSCGDGITNHAAGELCDDGNGATGDLCEACAPAPFVVDVGGWDGLWPDVAVARDGADEVFLVAFKRGNTNDVVFQKYDREAQPIGGAIELDVDGGAGPLAMAASPVGGALVAWQVPDGSYGATRYRLIDAGLAPVPGVGEWSGSRDPQVAGGADGGYCVGGFLKSVPVPVHCVDAQGNPTGNASFPSTFGGEYYEGSHEIIAVGDGYVFSYVPDDVSNDLVGYTLGPDASQGSSFPVTSWGDAYYSWVPRWSGRAGADGFVALAGLMTGTERHLFQRVYASPGSPATDLEPVTDETLVREGLALQHASGRYLVAWLGDVVIDPSTGYTLSCAIKVQRFTPEGAPAGDAVVLHDPEGEICSQGVRGAVDADGNVLLSWMDVAVNDTMGTKYGMLLPALLAE
jgi:hypothetical protein